MLLALAALVTGLLQRTHASRLRTAVLSPAATLTGDSDHPAHTVRRGRPGTATTHTGCPEVQPSKFGEGAVFCCPLAGTCPSAAQVVLSTTPSRFGWVSLELGQDLVVSLGTAEFCLWLAFHVS